MQEKRRLRKAEREIVESVAAKAVEELAPNFDEIERRVVEGYLVSAFT